MDEIAKLIMQLDEKFTAKFDEQDKKLEELKSDIVKINVTIENTVMPQLDILAEGQQTLLEQTASRARADDLDEEVKFLKYVVRQLGDDVRQLKKAQ